MSNTSTDNLKLALVGARNIGRNHFRRAQDLPGVVLHAVADTDPERRAEAAEEFGCAKVYGDAAEAFADDAVDAVILALPNALHEPLTAAALKAGKHVLIEKPIARTTAEADAMIAAREASGKTLMVGMNQRFSPKTAGIRQLLADGAIGELTLARAWWVRGEVFGGLWQRGDWFLGPEASGGGPLLDLGIHKLDQVLHVMGFPTPTAVSATCAYGIGKAEGAKRGKDYRIEDGGTALVRTTGCPVLLEANYFSKHPPTPEQNIVVEGVRGDVDMSRGTYLVDGEERPIPEDDGVATSAVEHFVRVLRGTEELSSTAEEGRAGLAAVEAAYASAAQGKEVVL